VQQEREKDPKWLRMTLETLAICVRFHLFSHYKYRKDLRFK